MSRAWMWTRSFVFTVQLYAVMAVMGIVFLPWALASPKGARTACTLFCHWARFSVKWMCGITTEVRGEVPTDEVMIAAKHQSFLDILMIFEAVPAAKFIMKRELLYTPVIGQYAYRIGCVPVDRGKRGQAIAKMVADVEKGRAEPGQLIIYPQGSRIAPGIPAPYKVGSMILFRQLKQDCVPVATNVGLVWPRSGILKRPGHGVVEFLPRIPAETPPETFLARLEQEVETASDALLEEGGFKRIEIDA
ncbi:1-acyl-sn-glycerol-3-phosphate acyltransferase [Roseivivax marinus]|uniref:lysophospholipid acyltransferase family protein n=1 Tax=Roseivivax marinus TaxID=1379903 RepID=UPI0005C18E1D|nr:lysophospholipid acyltransferase family protein [Roseivivax marinus]UMA66595.1 1-acyl-sn-glycerol-3-phosphate acyltransferase [Roseivivax marinus]